MVGKIVEMKNNELFYPNGMLSGKYMRGIVLEENNDGTLNVLSSFSGNVCNVKLDDIRVIS